MGGWFFFGLPDDIVRVVELGLRSRIKSLLLKEIVSEHTDVIACVSKQSGVTRKAKTVEQQDFIDVYRNDCRSIRAGTTTVMKVQEGKKMGMRQHRKCWIYI
jgi:hypothetical protein